MKPNSELLYLAVNRMAKDMGLDPLSNEESEDLMGHVLYDKEWKKSEGKNAWSGFTRGVITADELPHLIMAHCATKISAHNNIQEPDSSTYLNSDISAAFHSALFGSHES